LPQRTPQQHLVDELKEEPVDDSPGEVPFGDRSARSLAAFYKGTRLGRESVGDV
jgi:hypothetical protein